MNSKFIFIAENTDLHLLVMVLFYSLGSHLNFLLNKNEFYTLPYIISVYANIENTYLLTLKQQSIFFLQHYRLSCHYGMCKRQQSDEYGIQVQIRVT